MEERGRRGTKWRRKGKKRKADKSEKNSLFFRLCAPRKSRLNSPPTRLEMTNPLICDWCRYLRGGSFYVCFQLRPHKKQQKRPKQCCPEATYTNHKLGGANDWPSILFAATRGVGARKQNGRSAERKKERRKEERTRGTKERTERQKTLTFRIILTRVSGSETPNAGGRSVS